MLGQRDGAAITELLAWPAIACVQCEQATIARDGVDAMLARTGRLDLSDR